MDIILSFLNNHSHYWGIPHERSSDYPLIQICYECGAERPLKVELRPFLGRPAARVGQPEIEAA